MTARVAIYAGSFDPLTNGHMDVLKGALTVSDKIFVGIGIQASKTPLFSLEERIALIEQATADELGPAAKKIETISFSGLVIDAAKKCKAKIIIRGLRDGTDLDYEMQMAGMNRQMAGDVQTVFLPAGVASRPITATLVRQIAAMGGDVSAFVPAPVFTALQAHKKG